MKVSVPFCIFQANMTVLFLKISFITDECFREKRDEKIQVIMQRRRALLIARFHETNLREKRL